MSKANQAATVKTVAEAQAAYAVARQEAARADQAALAAGRAKKPVQRELPLPRLAQQKGASPTVQVAVRREAFNARQARGAAFGIVRDAREALQEAEAMANAQAAAAAQEAEAARRKRIAAQLGPQVRQAMRQHAPQDLRRCMRAQRQGEVLADVADLRQAGLDAGCCVGVAWGRAPKQAGRAFRLAYLLFIDAPEAGRWPWESEDNSFTALASVRRARIALRRAGYAVAGTRAMPLGGGRDGVALIVPLTPNAEARGGFEPMPPIASQPGLRQAKDAAFARAEAERQADLEAAGRVTRARDEWAFLDDEDAATEDWQFLDPQGQGFDALERAERFVPEVDRTVEADLRRIDQQVRLLYAAHDITFRDPQEYLAWKSKYNAAPKGQKPPRPEAIAYPEYVEAAAAVQAMGAAERDLFPLDSQAERAWLHEMPAAPRWMRGILKLGVLHSRGLKADDAAAWERYRTAKAVWLARKPEPDPALYTDLPSAEALLAEARRYRELLWVSLDDERQAQKAADDTLVREGKREGLLLTAKLLQAELEAAAIDDEEVAWAIVEAGQEVGADDEFAADNE